MPSLRDDTFWSTSPERWRATYPIGQGPGMQSHDDGPRWLMPPGPDQLPNPSPVDAESSQDSVQPLAGLRVLLVASEAPPIVSGVSRAVDWLSRGLVESGADVDVLSANEVRRWTVGEIRISSLVAHWSGIRRSLPRYDVVNLHGPAPTMSDVFLARYGSLTRLTRPALVYTHHSDIDLQGLGGLCRLYNAAAARLARRADRIIVTSASYAQQIQRPGGPPVDVVPWGVDLDTFAEPGPLRRGHGPLRVLFVGQLRPYKGVSVLLRAVSGQAALRLTIVGSGPLDASLRREAETLGTSNVTFTGRIPDDELRRLYSEHDVICLPSTTRAEAFGLVLLEGMAAGCVPVASDLPGVRDLAGTTGLLVRPGDAAELQRALLHLAATGPRLAALAAASRVEAQRFPWHTVTRGYVQALTAAVDAVQLQRRQGTLGAPLRRPATTAPALANAFGASWWSVLVVAPEVEGHAYVGWGRAARSAPWREPSPISQYVARVGRPVLLDPDLGEHAVQPLLTRTDVASAMAVPVQIRDGLRAVLSLSVASGMGPRYSSLDLRELGRLVGL